MRFWLTLSWSAAMAEGWTAISLGDVLTERRERVTVNPERDYPFAGVLGFGRGMLLRPAMSGADIAAQHLFRVRGGQVIYSRLKAFEGAFALVTDEADGRYVSNEFPTFDVDTAKAEPTYVSLLLRRPSVWQELRSGSEGMGARRERLQPTDFLDLAFDLPPLAVQQRVVATAEAVERAEAAHARKGKAARNAHRAAREALIELAQFDRVELAELVHSVTGGKSPQCLNRPPAGDEFGVLKVSSIRDGWFRSSEAKALPSDQRPAADSVHAGDLLYSRANTESLVGAMCRVQEDNERLLLCDKTIRIEVDEDRVDPDYLVEAVGTSSAREQIEGLAGGTSESMRNISQAAFLATEIALPSVVVTQRAIATKLCALRRVAQTAELEAARLQQLRGALIEELVGAA